VLGIEQPLVLGAEVPAPVVVRHLERAHRIQRAAVRAYALVGTPVVGYQAKGIIDDALDILTSIDSKPVRSSSDIRDFVAEMEPGATIPITIRRKNQELKLDMIVGTQPDDWGGAKRTGE